MFCYFINGVQVTREAFSYYLADIYGGSPIMLINTYDRNVSTFFNNTGATMFIDHGIRAAVTVC